MNWMLLNIFICLFYIISCNSQNHEEVKVSNIVDVNAGVFKGCRAVVVLIKKEDNLAVITGQTCKDKDLESVSLPNVPLEFLNIVQ